MKCNPKKCLFIQCYDDRKNKIKEAYYNGNTYAEFPDECELAELRDNSYMIDRVMHVRIFCQD